MKCLLVIFSVLLIWTSNGFCQNGNSEMDLFDSIVRNKIYEPGKSYTYQLTTIDSNQDTISEETLRMRIPKDLKTKSKRESTIWFVWEYNFTEEDSLKYGQKTKDFIGRNWMRRDTTTLRLCEEDLYLHPIRENQYYGIEIAPHPTIEFADYKDQTFKSTIYVIKNYGQYNSTKTYSNYDYISDNEIQFKNEKLNCLLFHSEAKNEKHGVSKAEFIFSPQYGYMQMDYDLYDGTKIIITMIDASSN